MAFWSWCGQSERDESRTASEPCCVGSGDGAGGGALVGLDSDAGLINTPTDGCSQQAPTWPGDKTVAVAPVYASRRVDGGGCTGRNVAGAFGAVLSAAER